MVQRHRKRKKKVHGKKGLNHSPLGQPSRDFLDRDLSLLYFNQRVLEQAEDENQPLLERVRFLSIFHSNIDEFFMKRVGVPRRSALFSAAGHRQDRMVLMRNTVFELFAKADHCFNEALSVELRKEGIFLLKWEEITAQEKKKVNDIFEKQIFPILTPLAVDSAHPFPHISNLSTSLAVSLRGTKKSELLFSRVKIPKIFPPWYSVNQEKKRKGDEVRLVNLNDVIRHNLGKLFPNTHIEATMLFRVIRNINLERDEEIFDDFLEMMEEELKQRRFGEVVKLEIESKVDSWLLQKLMVQLELSPSDVYQTQGLIDYSKLNTIANLDIPHLKYSSWSPMQLTEFPENGSNIFDVISQKDILVHHPYESFSGSVERFIQSASEDPNVRAIKITLYRTHEKGAIVPALIQAAEMGKEVVCLIELKARFDEERNIYWANRMEGAGIHVVYGFQGLKIHSKLLLVVRQEGEEIKTYLHVGTGNYHSQTAKLYTDMGLFTSHPHITAEVVDLFNFLTGLSRKSSYEHLLVSPINMKERFLELIDGEIQNARQNKPSHIIAKCNSLEDHGVIKKLYEASSEGVQIDLIVRGICTLKPKVNGLSEKIRVISVVDRFLEHSRIFYFRNGQSRPEDGIFYIGSADWMHRNLVGRVEVACPIYDASIKEGIYQVLVLILQEDVQTWELQSDGSYKRFSLSKAKPMSSQAKLMKRASQHLGRKPI